MHFFHHWLQIIQLMAHLGSIFVASCPCPIDPNTNKTLERRAFSIAFKPDPTGQEQRVSGSRWRWPLECGKRTVKYCFVDVRSNKNLHHLVVKPAIAKFAFPMAIGSLNFQHVVPSGIHPDDAICDQQDISQVSTLQIKDATIDGNDKENEKCISSATHGFSYNFLPPVNDVTFCALLPKVPPVLHEQKEIDLAIATMTHELGHVIGLDHEHQRPRRDQAIQFYPENLYGYAGAVQSALRDDQHLFRPLTTEAERARLITTERKYASAYFPGVLDWLIEDYPPGTADDTDSFDTQSMMIYSGLVSSIDPTDPNKRVLRKKDATGRPILTPDGDIHQGGSEVPSAKELSLPDIARILFLYPIEAAPQPPNHPPRDTPSNPSFDYRTWRPVMVTLYGFTTRITPPNWPETISSTTTEAADPAFTSWMYRNPY